MHARIVQIIKIRIETKISDFGDVFNEIFSVKVGREFVVDGHVTLRGLSRSAVTCDTTYCIPRISVTISVSQSDKNFAKS